jgi:hypothetical protein
MVRALIVAIVVTPACATEASGGWSVPSRDASPEERIDAYRRLAPRESPGADATSVVLASGRELDNAEDVLELVAPASEAGLSAERSRDVSHDAWRVIGYGALTELVSIAPFAYAAAAPTSGTASLSTTGRISMVALGVVILGIGVIELIYGFDRRHAARESLSHALAVYDEGLRERLNLCPSKRAESVEVHPCEAFLRPVRPEGGP